MDFSLAFRAFFGINPNDIGERVVVTNISPIYTALIENANSVDATWKGFYTVTKLCLSKDKHFHVIRIIPGSSIVDVVKLLTLYVKKLYFVGIAGCLDSSRSMGEVCEPSEFVSQNFPCEIKGLAICQTSGLIQATDFYMELQKKKVVLVDMECYDVYRICKDNHVPLKYIVQISDFPLETPFYNVSSQPINIEQIINLLHDE